MPVNYTPPTPEQLLPVPGVTLGTAPARIKNWSRDDLLLVSLASGTQAAGVFTQNRFCAAPVHRLPRASRRAAGASARCVINTGNANAGTGDRRAGRRARDLRRAAAAAGLAPKQVLPFSTGVIMEPLPVERIVAGIAGGACRRSRETHGPPRPSAIMTTDTVPKARLAAGRRRRPFRSPSPASPRAPA